MARMPLAPSPMPRLATCRPASRWARAAASAVPFCVLPSAGWRIGHVVDAVLAPDRCDKGGAGELVYVTGLSVVSMAAALLTVLLVRPCGEALPRWIPIAGGRRVPVRAATLTASAGATVLALICAYWLSNQIFGFVEGPLEPVPAGCGPPRTAVGVLYAPLVLWPVLLALVTLDFHRRHGSPWPRTRRPATPRHQRSCGLRDRWCR